MAKIELKFLDDEDNSTLQVVAVDNFIKIIALEDGTKKDTVIVNLDKSTAIKFAKTLRTEINKIKETNSLDELSNTF